MHNDLVSIIMPMHNSASYVGEAITSVLKQTYPHWELLVIEDASKDNSCDIVRTYQEQDSRIHLLINDHHTGRPSSPRNMGVKHAKGRYIAFLDSDDVWFPEKLQQQIPLFEDEKVAIVYSNYEKMDEDYVLWLSILKQGFIAKNTNTTNAAYRIVAGSISANKLKVLPWQWSVYRDIEGLSLLRSSYHFINYAFKAYFKSKI